jgi:hypothetical protein
MSGPATSSAQRTVPMAKPSSGAPRRDISPTPPRP